MVNGESTLDRRRLLSALWLFAILNYLYCDVLSLMDSEVLRQVLTGSVDGMEMTPGFLLAASVLMEIPIAMTILARFLAHPANRWANLVAGAIMTVVQAVSLTVGSPTVYYAFFSVIEMATTASIFWLALRWQAPNGAMAAAG